MLSLKQHQKREKIVARLRKQGYSNGEIAQKVGLGYSLASSILSKLIANGKIEPLPRGTGAKSFWRDLKHPKTQTIIAMVRACATLEQIGRAIGLTTRERPRQLIENMTALHSAGIWQSKEVHSVPEAAKALKVHRNLIVPVLLDEGVHLQKRGRREYLLDKEAMDFLRVHPRITRKKNCVVCTKPFICSKFKNCTITCGKKCARQRHRQMRQKQYRQMKLVKQARTCHQQNNGAP